MDVRRYDNDLEDYYGRREALQYEAKLNEYKHIEPVKQKKYGLAPEQNEAACKEGLKANSSKVKAIIDLKPPRTLKEIYRDLTKKLAALRIYRNVTNTYGPNKRRSIGKPIRVLTDKPIKQILARPEKSERIAKWSIEFKGHNSVKGKILADFLAETPSVEGKDTETMKPKMENVIPNSRNT
ncbi:hypothetical protein Tco_1477456 [Tanacetum coccineum]